MISIGLIGDETLAKLLRLATYFTILQLEEAFRAKIAWEMSLVKDPVHIKNLVDENYIEQLDIAKTDKAFGNQYHILALATFLQKDIYVYTKFPNIFLNSDKSIEDIQKAFEANELGRHVMYSPLKSSIFKVDRHKNSIIFGFFDSAMAHFTSLIPNDKNNLTLKPQHDWFKI
jgi:hypothetical protein